MAQRKEIMITWDEAVASAIAAARKPDKAYTETERAIGQTRVNAWIAVAQEIRVKNGGPNDPDFYLPLPTE